LFDCWNGLVLEWDFYMNGFLAPIEPVAPAFLAGLKAKAGKLMAENARAFRF
jgi:hypothetical protein